MAIRINLKNDIDNASLQVRDIAYYAEVSESVNGITNFPEKKSNGEVNRKKIGTITIVGASHIVVDSTVEPPADAFLMFSKDKVANNTSLLGYFAEVKLINNSTEKAELFALSSEIGLSSK